MNNEEPKKGKNALHGFLISVITVVCILVIIIQPIFVYAGIDAFYEEFTFQMESENSSPGSLPSPGDNSDIPSDKQNSAENSDIMADPTTLPEGEFTISDRDLSTSAVMTSAEIYEALSPSVVVIVAENSNGVALGTGVIMSKDGYIITNNHVITGCNNVYIISSDNFAYDAKLVGADSDSDLALLKADAEGMEFVPAEFGDSDNVVVGEDIICIGTPYGIEYSYTVTKGIISGIRNNVYVNNRKYQLLQTDAALNPGNSGGPIINQYGQVIGIVCSKIMTDGTDDYEGLGFAIPTQHVSTMINGFLEGETPVGKPILGLTVMYIDEATAAENNLVAGAYVMSIDTDCSAYKRGLIAGDVITKLNGKTFTSTDGFVEEKDKFSPGDSIDIEYWRDGQTYNISVILMEDMT